MKNIQQIELAKNEYYVYPEKARQKMNMAQEYGRTVYIYAMTGYGKTAFVSHFLSCKSYQYIDAEIASMEDFSKFDNLSKTDSQNIIDNQITDSNNKKPKKKIIVIDNLQFVESDEIKEMIRKILPQKEFWIILVSRAKCPVWLLSHQLKQFPFIEIGEKDLILSQKETEKYFNLRGLFFNEKMLLNATQQLRGNAMAIRIMSDILVRKYDEISREDDFDEDTVKQFKNTFWDYLDHYVFGQWEQEIFEFYIQMSIVDQFDIELAETITGSSNVEYILKRSMEIGNFLHNFNDIYWMDQSMILSMKRHLQLTYSKEQRDELYYNAGLYYKRKDDVLEALCMFEACDNKNQISRILVENARKNPSTGHLYKLRHYYLSMDDKIISEKLELMACMSMLQAILFNVEESEHWYQEIKKKEKLLHGAEKKVAKSWIAYLEIALPQIKTTSYPDIFKNVGLLITNRSINLPEFGVTGNSYSQMNGGKDFCEWTKRDLELAKGIGKFLELVLGKHGVGCIDLALAESFFEKGMDEFEIIRRISRAQIQIEAKGTLDSQFVAFGLLSRISLLKGDAENAREILEEFKNKADWANEVRFFPNVENYLCKIHMYLGELPEIEKWMNSVPKETEEFYTLNRYIYLTKTRVYLMLKKFDKAFALITKLQYYAELYDRKYISMECELLLAILDYRSGKNNWKKILQKVYSEIEEYHFVRIISQEGAAILPLLKGMNIKAKDKELLAQILEETEKMATFYPEYMREIGGNDESFAENALQVLRYQAEGLSNEKIAAKMGINIGTVKYHCRENYRKLGVTGKAAAVSEAKKRKLI